MNVEEKGTLEQALKKYEISLSASKVRRLQQYSELLWEWNTHLNLTRHTDYDKFVSRDVVDSLALESFLRREERVLDVGTGGGVPGIILAILRPDLQLELCDSTGKKAMAISEILQELHLDIPVHHSKAEAVLAQRGKGTRFTTLTIRAVSRLPQILRMLGPYWTVFDRLLLIKGPKWTEERGEARHYNLMSKLALRCLQKYPTSINETESIESVVLQICPKDHFNELDKIIDDHKTEQPDPPEEFRPSFRKRFKHRQQPKRNS